ncbi:MAG: glycosyltransferase, partial [Paracoccaceae bacterium]
MAPKISVVIPVYCVEQYVEKCLETVQKQTLKDIEIITVNDCSPDNSQDIIDRLAKDDKRIKSIILETNGGQGFARNEGLRVATGEYVHFLDSDDYLASLNTYEIFYTRAVRDQADVIRGRVWRKSELQGVKSKLRLSKKEFYFSNDLSSVTLEHHPELLVATAVKNILCKRDFLCDNQIVFKLPKWEDFPFSYEALFKAERITSIPDFISVYRKRTGSTTTTSLKLDRDIDLSFQNVQFVMNMLIEHGVSFEKSQLPLHVRYLLA